MSDEKVAALVKEAMALLDEEGYAPDMHMRDVMEELAETIAGAKQLAEAYIERLRI